MSWKPFAVMIAGACVVLLAISAMRSPDIEAIIIERVIGISAVCDDGMYSTSDRDSGTCSGHGGVSRWIVE